jgi:hypothetical protein
MWKIFCYEERGICEAIARHPRNPSVLVRYRNLKIRKVGHWKE